MKPVHCVRTLSLLTLMLGVLMFAVPSAAQAPPPSASPTLPSETPSQFMPATDSFDYTRRDVMIPMRDGVKLHTVILVPKGAKNAPILFTRTPYNATDLTTHAHSSHLGPSLKGYDNALEVILEGGYIRVVQDVRGKYGSEGARQSASRAESFCAHEPHGGWLDGRRLVSQRRVSRTEHALHLRTGSYSKER